MKPYLAYFTDKGSKKAHNEDALAIRTADTIFGPLVLAAVCDGVGGMDKGELASSIAVRALSDWFDDRLPVFVRDGYDFFRLRSGLEYEIRSISKDLFRYSKQNGIRMGTTLAALLYFDGHCITANVGDSRVYAVGGKLRQLTEDHSLVQKEINEGKLKPEDAAFYDRRNVILQCLGMAAKLEPDISEWVLPENTYLLCSDGFYHELRSEEISAELMASAPRGESSVQHTLEELSKRCMGRGETDNITAVVVQVR